MFLYQPCEKDGLLPRRTGHGKLIHSTSFLKANPSTTKAANPIPISISSGIVSSSYRSKRTAFMSSGEPG